MFLRINIVLL